MVGGGDGGGGRVPLAVVNVTVRLSISQTLYAMH